MDSEIWAKKSIHQKKIWKAFLAQINVDQKILIDTEYSIRQQNTHISCTDIG
jgi:hypothetical protein